jgi:signal transduction histidine kinase
MFLAVDDEPRNLEAIVRTLRSLGPVETAHSGDEAWARFRATPFEAVITDQRMPGMSGVELLSRVSEHSPKVARVLVTAYADMDATVDAINRGRIDLYVKKPWDPEQLQERVRSLLEQRNVREQGEALTEELAARNCALAHALDVMRASHEQLSEAERWRALFERLQQMEGEFGRTLASIAASTDQLRRAGAVLGDAQLRTLAGEAFESAERLRALHARLRGEHPEAAAVLRAAELDVSVEAALASLEPSASRAGITLDRHLAAGAHVALDPERFACALDQLVRNAIEASPGGGEVSIVTGREGDHALVRIADSGAGIPAEIRERAFEPFVTAGKPHANGLGLPVARAVIEGHGGTLDFQDREGGGTVFTLRLPVVPRPH